MRSPRGSLLAPTLGLDRGMPGLEEEGVTAVRTAGGSARYAEVVIARYEPKVCQVRSGSLHSQSSEWSFPEKANSQVASV